MSPGGSDGPLMPSRLTKAPSKGLFGGSRRAVKGKGMMKLCPSSTRGFSLLTCPHPRLTQVPTTLFITSITPPSPPRQSWQFPQGRMRLCPCTLANPWEAPGRQRCGVAPTGVTASVPRAGTRQGAQRGYLTQQVQTTHPDKSSLPAWHLQHLLGCPAPSPDALLPVYSIYIIYIY